MLIKKNFDPLRFTFYEIEYISALQYISKQSSSSRQTFLFLLLNLMLIRRIQQIPYYPCKYVLTIRQKVIVLRHKRSKIYNIFEDIKQ